MAITKHDMFDFLIDIVPREEVQFKSRAQSKVREGEREGGRKGAKEGGTKGAKDEQKGRGRE